jgi:cystathionine beta-lyase/cystathionine gamma-synthase
MNKNTLITDSSIIDFLKQVLEHQPEDWTKLTTHRLDIYNESQAKAEFLEKFEALYQNGNLSRESLAALPTAFDYIRLGHPLSCVLEWAIAKENNLGADRVIAFSSVTMPVFAVLRKNKLDGKKTAIVHDSGIPDCFDPETLRKVYGYDFDLVDANDSETSNRHSSSQILLSRKRNLENQRDIKPDFEVQIIDGLGSIITIKEETDAGYINAIQHVRRRESIAMTPADTLTALQELIGQSVGTKSNDRAENLLSVRSSIREITHTGCEPLVASSGLSIQYAIMMGLVDHAKQNYPNKPIKIIVPPNCYGGTNDQARRVAAAVENVSIMDLPVDGDNDMVRSTEKVLEKCAELDAVPLIIAEIPTNPRVEVPDLAALKTALLPAKARQAGSRKRKTSSGSEAISPIFILDQTFCPNYNFLGQGRILSEIQAISYVSGSKFPSGGRCTAGYCVSSEKGQPLLELINKHLCLCDNEATDLQLEILAEQLPSMNQRIADAYKNTREYVNFIHKVLPEAKINFVDEKLAADGFTPSVFSLDLPTKGNSPEERENYKRDLNLKLINAMITRIPHESKYVVSYGQLKGSYWTIPATSTQGTTREGDKDYIARVSLAPEMNMEMHKRVFKEFVEEHIN